MIGKELICVCAGHSLYKAVAKIKKTDVSLPEYQEVVKFGNASQEIGLILK